MDLHGRCSAALRSFAVRLLCSISLDDGEQARALADRVPLPMVPFYIRPLTAGSIPLHAMSSALVISEHQAASLRHLRARPGTPIIVIGRRAAEWAHAQVKDHDIARMGEILEPIAASTIAHVARMIHFAGERSLDGAALETFVAWSILAVPRSEMVRCFKVSPAGVEWRVRALCRACDVANLGELAHDLLIGHHAPTPDWLVEEVGAHAHREAVRARSRAMTWSLA